MNIGHYADCTAINCRCEERTYWGVLAISLAIAGLEFWGASVYQSLALASDGVHVLVDGLAAGVAIMIARTVRRGCGTELTLRHRGGYVQAVLLYAAAVWILWEASWRLVSPYEVAGLPMLIVAALGAVGNAWQHYLLERTRAHHVTHRGLHAHVLSDFWQSIGVILSAVIITLTGVTLVDPLVSVIIALYLGHSARNILRAVHAPQPETPHTE